MKCSQVHKNISEYIDGLLDETATHQLEAHIAACGNCAKLLAELELLVKAARHLEAVQPSEDVWFSIRKGLIQNERKAEIQRNRIHGLFNFIHNPKGLALAFSTVMVIIISITIFYLGVPFWTNDPNDPIQVAQHHFEEAEKHYQLAIDSLNTQMPDYMAKLPSDLLAVFSENLKIIDQSIQVCRAAIEEHPQNKAANTLLMACYKKKIELLNEIKNLAMQAG